MWKTIKPYLISISIALGVGLLSAFLTRDSRMIYNDINRPFLSPPAVLFPIVWTLLYILMGISSAMVWNKRAHDPAAARRGLWLYACNLVLNFGWSLIFFRARAFFLALLWLIVLWIIIYRMIIQFKKVSPLAGNLQIPYLVWVAFAGYLNASIWLIN